MKKNQGGFGLVGVLMVFVAVALIAGIGWYVWRSNHDEQTRQSNTQTASTAPDEVLQEQTPTDQPAELKEYANQTYGFSFQYPATWELSNNLEDLGRGAEEGEIIVTSPSGTKVYFQPNLGGKGGSCWDVEADALTTRTCQTRTIYSVEKLASSSDDNPIYLYHASYTAPTNDGGGTYYTVYIQNGDYLPLEPSSEVGSFIPYWSEITPKYGGVGVKVGDTSDSLHSSQDYFTSNEVTEATPILKSFKIL